MRVCRRTTPIEQRCSSRLACLKSVPAKNGLTKIPRCVNYTRIHFLIALADIGIWCWHTSQVKAITPRNFKLKLKIWFHDLSTRRSSLAKFIDWIHRENQVDIAKGFLTILFLLGCSMRFSIFEFRGRGQWKRSLSDVPQIPLCR